MTPEQVAKNAELDRLDALPTRPCPFCGATMWAIHDTAAPGARAHECESCLAVYWITKGAPQKSNGLSIFWYHGAQQVDTGETPGDRINGDGGRFPAPIPFAHWYALATEKEPTP